MFCLKCGRGSDGNQNFCRTCGLDLRKVTRALETEFTTEELELTDEEAQRRALRTAFRILPWAVLVMFVGTVIGVVGKKITHDELLAGIGAVVAIAGIFFTVVPFTMPAIYQQGARRAKAKTGSLDGASRAALPEERFVADVPSVTEQTTEPLPAERLVHREPSGELPA